MIMCVTHLNAHYHHGGYHIVGWQTLEWTCSWGEPGSTICTQKLNDSLIMNSATHTKHHSLIAVFSIDGYQLPWYHMIIMKLCKWPGIMDSLLCTHVTTIVTLFHYCTQSISISLKCHTATPYKQFIYSFNLNVATYVSGSYVLHKLLTSASSFCIFWYWSMVSSLN